MPWTDPKNWSANELVTELLLDAQVKGNLDHLYSNLPTRPVMWHDESLVTVGNAIARVIDATQQYNGYGRQSTPANGDTFTQSFVCAAGTYTLAILGHKEASSGIIDWYVDGTLFASGDDFYAAAPAANTLFSHAGLVIATGGRHQLKGVVNGKNGASASYRIDVTVMYLIPAAD